MPQADIVCDTSLLLYLGRIGHEDLLPTLYSRVLVPDAVLLELDVGRQLRHDTISPRKHGWATAVAVSPQWVDELPPNRLGAGELAVVAYANAHASVVAGLDDLQARRLAGELGLKVAGTLGILLQAKQSGALPAIRPLLGDLHNQGFRLAPELHLEILVLAGESR